MFPQTFLETKLDIKKTRHQMSVKDVIYSSQARSTSYKQWKKERNQARHQEDPSSNVSQGCYLIISPP